MAGKQAGCLVGVALAVLTTLSAARPARADEGDCGLGGVGVMIGTGLGLGVASVSALTFPALARAANPRLRYWPGVGWTMLGGTAGALGTGVLSLQGCPDESVWTPSAVALVSSGLTTLIWGSVAKPKRQPALLVTVPRTGQGMLVGVGTTF